MTTTALSTRRSRGINHKGRALQQLPREKGCSLPEYLEAPEVNALIAAAPNPQAGLLMLEQRWAELRVSEVFTQDTRDLH